MKYPVTVVSVDCEDPIGEDCHPTRENPVNWHGTVTITIDHGIPSSPDVPRHETLIGKCCKCRQGHPQYGIWRLPNELSKWNSRADLIAFLQCKPNGPDGTYQYR